MEITTITTGTALRSGSVAPVFAGTQAGVCPQGAFRRVGVFATDVKLRSANVPAAGSTGMATGHRTWSPPIT